MSISELFSLPEEEKKAIFEHILQQANRSQRKMVVNQEYIQQHLNRQNAIKLRALDINNFLSEVDTGYEDCQVFPYCNVAIQALDLKVEPAFVCLHYEDLYDSYDNRTWYIPMDLFNISDEELVEYAKQQAAAQSALDKKVDYARLRKQAKELGFKLIPIENTGE